MVIFLNKFLRNVVYLLFVLVGKTTNERLKMKFFTPNNREQYPKMKTILWVNIKMKNARPEIMFLTFMNSLLLIVSVEIYERYALTTDKFRDALIKSTLYSIAIVNMNLFVEKLFRRYVRNMCNCVDE